MSGNNNIIELFKSKTKTNDSVNALTSPNDASEDGSEIDLSVDTINRIVEAEINAKVTVISRQIANMIIDVVEKAELNPEHIDASHDFYLVIESIMSMLYKMHHIYHPIQEIADDYIHVEMDGSVRYGNDADADVGIEPED